MAQDRNFAGKPRDLVRQALKIERAHPKALWLSATIALAGQNYDAALRDFRQFASVAQSDPELIQAANSASAEIEARHGKSQLAQSEGPLVPVISNPSISGTVSIARELAATIRPTDTLFVFARAPSGPRMPLAMIRVHGPTFPAKFQLDDSLAMSPAKKLSDFPVVTLVARVPRSGNAQAQPGDLEDSISSVKLGTAGLSLIIRRVLP